LNTFAENSRAAARLTPPNDGRNRTSVVLESSASCDAPHPAYCRCSTSVQSYPIKETPRMEFLRPTAGRQHEPLSLFAWHLGTTDWTLVQLPQVKAFAPIHLRCVPRSDPTPRVALPGVFPNSPGARRIKLAPPTAGPFCCHLFLCGVTSLKSARTGDRIPNASSGRLTSGDGWPPEREGWSPSTPQRS
jgi:hypothetical protein